MFLKKPRFPTFVDKKLKLIHHLQSEIKNCTHCSLHLPFGANPIFSFSEQSKIVLVSQAPGILAHQKSIPYQDKSGERLRSWLGVSDEVFYNPDNFAILPMGFCYPGKGKSGDLPPRKECAPLWHNLVWQQLNHVQLTILIGQYAQQYYLKEPSSSNLTARVRAYENYLPQFFPLVHPSPLNQGWMKKNEWFEQKVLPVLKDKIKAILKN